MNVNLSTVKWDSLYITFLFYIKIMSRSNLCPLDFKGERISQYLIKFVPWSLELSVLTLYTLYYSKKYFNF